MVKKKERKKRITNTIENLDEEEMYKKSIIKKLIGIKKNEPREKKKEKKKEREKGRISSIKRNKILLLKGINFCC